MSVSPKQASTAEKGAEGGISHVWVKRHEIFEDECGLSFVNVTNGLGEVPQKFSNSQEVSSDYDNLSRQGRNCELPWNFLVSSVTQFVGFSVKSAISQGEDSAVAFCLLP